MVEACSTIYYNIGSRKIIKVKASNKETEEKVLFSKAEVKQPVTTYVFTKQGSQEQGIGIELYASSPVTKEV
ncbi:Fatty acid synthase subunit beta 4 [Colletotrichum chlorophyti]|uniref:Fatty acid synthase subunit beta 4 n=1 Tax=Colletotrichum chlorophyti TaxID=708187 RepID=A0A1Q8S2P5_9PEZI|nr:Fatty acid synthase subunit beta 4 [Colletotrichum chlorophyti]